MTGVDEIPDDYVESLELRGFTLSEQLGRGATGRVYKARQRSLERDVAVKFFDNELNVRSRQMGRRFARESKLLACVTSQYVPYVLTHGTTKKLKTPYYVMQYLPGEPLSVRLAEKGAFSEEVALSYVRQVLAALSAAHKAKVLHRDVTPRNVLEHQGQIYLIDFSIGGWLGNRADTPVTTHERLGMPEYAAPEQKENAANSDARSDVFSVGVLLFELLAGHSRVRLSDLAKLLPKTRPGVRDAISAACNEDPDFRYQSAAEFRAALTPTHATVVFRGVPSAAFCENLKCSGARWNREGTFSGPLVVKGCTDNHCRRCGRELVYECRGCGTGFEDDQYCGACGTQFFGAPVCRSCGARLKLKDLDLDTKSRGCSSCSWTMGYEPTDPGDDDIPF